MKGILKFLERAKLIEPSADERLGAAEAELPAAEAHAEVATGVARVPETSLDRPPQPPASAPAEPSAGDAEGLPLVDIFAAADIPTSPYPAEKLLRLLDGLRAMDARTRQAAVLAMDAADDNWQIGDCVSDAELKISALDAYKQQLSEQLQSREQQSAEIANQIRLALDRSTAAIRQQIAELEQLLEREVTRAAQETTSVEAGLRAAREATARETRRMDTEIERLREIPAHFKDSQATAH